MPTLLERIQPKTSLFERISQIVSPAVKKVSKKTLRAFVPPPLKLEDVKRTIETSFKPVRKVEQVIGEGFEAIPEQLKEILLPRFTAPATAFPEAKRAERRLQKSLLQRIASAPVDPVVLGTVGPTVGPQIGRAFVGSVQKKGLQQIKNILPILERRGVKFPSGIDINEKVRIVLREAQTNPRIGDIVAEAIATPTEVFAGLPAKQLTQIAKQFKLSPQQIQNIGKDILTGLPQEVVSAVQKLQPTGEIIEGQKLLPSPEIKGEGFTVVSPRIAKASPILKSQQEATRLAKAEEKRLEKLQTGVGKLGRFLEQPPTPTQITKAVKESTGLSRTEDRVVTNEAKLLRLRLRAEQRVGKLAEAVGRREIRTVEATKRRTNALVKSINSLSERNIPFEFKEQVQSIMDKFDLHFRQPKTLARRQSTLEFVEGLKAQGELIPIPAERLALFDATTLNDLNLDQLQEIKDTVAQIVHVGSLKGKLIASKEVRDFTQVETQVVDQISQLGKVTPTIEEGFQPPSARKKGKIQQTVSNVDNYFANLRKVEFIARTLDNFKLGEVQKNLTDPILQESANNELLKQEEVFNKLQNIIKPVEKNFARIINEQKNVAGLKLTTQEMMGIYANSQNEGNLQRLTAMNLNEGQISQIINALSPQEKKVVDDVLDLIGGEWNNTNKVTLKLTGKPLGKIEGKYFPIVVDKDISKQARLREAERDLFQDVFERSSVERGFTKARIGGGEPVDLNFFSVVMEHLNKVIHYNTHALPVRDTQKLLASPRIRGAITQTMGENILRQFQPWLKDVSNPRSQSIQSMEKWARYLRRNSTTAILGLNMSVSLLQGGSFTLTMKEIGTADALRGLMDFWKNPIQGNNFVNEKSPQMKFRRKSFDREVQDWIKSQSVQKMIQNKRGAGDMLFSLITFVDRLATTPTWLGAYNKNMRLTGNESKAVAFADKTVRLTQPQGSARNLPQVARGSEFQKLFTQFYSHFTNVQNQMASIMDRLKLSPEDPLRKTRDWMTALLWVLVAPAIIGEWTRKGFRGLSPKEIITGIIGYGAGGLFLIRDVVNAMVKPFGFKAPPSFRGLEQLAFAGKEILRPVLEGKEIRGGKLFERVFKATGALTGKIPSEQAWRTMTGILDIMSGKSQDLRRLIFSKFALKEEGQPTNLFERVKFKREGFQRERFRRKQ